MSDTDLNSTSKTFVEMFVSQLQISEFNPRNTRSLQDIKKLADRIRNNGFEFTRALWVYPDGDVYKVFAGGNRFQAALSLGLETVPVFLHEGFTETEIVRLADVDNENDEYHTIVPLVDTWLSYKALSDLGWTQQMIADAKRVGRSTVAERLSYADFPDSVLKRFVEKDSLVESYAKEIGKLSNFDNLDSWLSRETAMCEIIDAILAKEKPTAELFKKAVDSYNGYFSKASEYYQKLGINWGDSFVQELSYAEKRANQKLRTVEKITAIYKIVNDSKLAEERAKRDAANRAASEAQEVIDNLTKEQLRLEYLERKTSRIVLGDSRECLKSLADNSVSLVLTDPPYGMDFQSNRRVVSAKADKIVGDMETTAKSLLFDVLVTLYPKMLEDSTLLVWTGWKMEPEFREIIEAAGFKVKGSIIWDKPNHGTGDLEGSFAPKHERIIHAVKGNPKFVGERIDDVQPGKSFMEDSDHPTKKPIDLLRKLIKTTTEKHALVVDPFAGSGSTVAATIAEECDFWACEVDEKYYKQLREYVHKLFAEKYDKKAKK